MIQLRDPIGPLPELPEREAADHEVAAGASAGVVAGLATLAAAVAGSARGSLFPLRLAAAAFLGEEALDPAAVSPIALGLLLAFLQVILLSLLFASLLPRAVTAAGALARGLLFGAATFVLCFYVEARLLDPVLFATARPASVLLLHLLFGGLLGLLLPPFRRVLP